MEIVCWYVSAMGIAVVNRFRQLNHTPIPIQLSERGVVPSVPSYADVHADSHLNTVDIRLEVVQYGVCCV